MKYLGLGKIIRKAVMRALDWRFFIQTFILIAMKGNISGLGGSH